MTILSPYDTPNREADVPVFSQTRRYFLVQLRNWLGAIGLAWILPGCQSKPPTEAGIADSRQQEVEAESEPLNSNDEEFEKLLAGQSPQIGRVVESDEFFEGFGTKYYFYSGNPERFQKFAEDIRREGAKSSHVIVVDGAVVGRGELGANIVFELPTESEKRQAIFDMHNQFWRDYYRFRHSDEPVSGDRLDELLVNFFQRDQNQRYLVVMAYEP